MSEIVDRGPERAPAVLVTYHRFDDPKRTITAWVVVACPFCSKPHRHHHRYAGGAVVPAGCGASKGSYRLAPAQVTR